MHERRMFDSGLWGERGERHGGRKHSWEEGGRRAGGIGPRWPRRGPSEDTDTPFGSEERPSRRGGRRSGGPGGDGPRGRARRGDARTIILDALRDGPKHGYEIIKALEERSAGRYVPSPGTVYPTLQFLEDQGLVRSQEEAERRVYQLTEAGQAELDAQARHVTAFWERIGGRSLPPATEHELNFLHEELEHLNRIVRSALRPAIAEDQTDTIRRVRGVIEECQEKVRRIIAGGKAE